MQPQALQNRQWTCACKDWVSTVTAVSVGCCPNASAEVAPQVKCGRSCHACVCISLETLQESVTQTASTWPAQTVAPGLNPLHQTLVHSVALLLLVKKKKKTLHGLGGFKPSVSRCLSEGQFNASHRLEIRLRLAVFKGWLGFWICRSGIRASIRLILGQPSEPAFVRRTTGGENVAYLEMVRC